MRKVLIADEDLEVSRLSFGTASLHHLFSSKNREHLIKNAISCGISHFDTSPYYGYGVAEAQLGKLESNIKQKITIATKVGIYPPRLSSSILPTSVIKVCGRFNNNAIKPIIDFSIKKSEESLNASLKRLNRDYIDILFLHEPSKMLINTDEYLNWQDKIIKEGKVLHFGLAGPVDKFIDLLKILPLSRILQVQDSLNIKEADLAIESGRKLQFTYGYLSSNKNNEYLSPMDILKAALQRNCNGSILISTRKAERVNMLCNIANNHDNKC